MTLRLLHLADLHLGQRFHQQDRAAEEQHALEQIISCCQQREVDVVLIAGDVFDTANPGAAESRRYHQLLARLVFEAGVGTVVVTAGNHDNALRIQGPQELYQAAVSTPLVCLTVTKPLRMSSSPCVIARARSGHSVWPPYLRDADLRPPVAGEDASTAAAGLVAGVSAYKPGIKPRRPTYPW